MSHVEVPSLYQEVEGVLITRDREVRAQEAVEASLVASSWTTPSSHPCLVHSTHLPLPCLNATKASRFSH